MSFIDKLKALLGGKKKPEAGPYAGLETQVDALENRLIITEHAKRIEGGVEGFDLALDETLAMVRQRGGRGPAGDALDVFVRRIELARSVAHLLRESDAQKRAQLAAKFLADFRDVRDRLHNRTRIKYERVRIDVESGRLR
jgi:hypothetical protein